MMDTLKKKKILEEKIIGNIFCGAKTKMLII